MSKPTILLVPGAYHTAESFHLIIPRLEALSYPLATVLLASLGKHNPTSTYVDDVDAIHKVLLPILESGKQVVIVAHSWGAIPAAASVEGQSIEERSARGEKGGIKSLLLIAGSVITKRGLSLAEENYGNAAPEDAVNYVDIAVGLLSDSICLHVYLINILAKFLVIRLRSSSPTKTREICSTTT